MRATPSDPAACDPADTAPGEPGALDAPAPGTWPFVERRRGGDRRARPTRWYDSVRGHRRRRRGRRAGEQIDIYVDAFHVRDVLIVVLVFLLNLADAGMTLHHLSAGAVEENPLMDQLIRWSPAWFLAEKICIVGLCLLTLAIHKTFRLARYAAHALLAVYGLLTVHHILLM